MPLVHQRGQRCVPQRDVNACTLSGLLPVVESGEDGTDGVHAGHDVNPRHADLGRAALSIPGDGHDAAARLHGQVKCDFVTTWAVLTVAGNAADDGVLGNFANDGVKRSRFEVLKDHVSVGHQGAYALLLLLDVDRLDCFATVARQEVRGHVFAVKTGLEGGAPRTGVVTPWSLKFQHISTKITERLSRMRASEDSGKVKHANAGQRLHTPGFPASQFNLCVQPDEFGAVEQGLESSVLVGLDLLAHVLGSSLGCLHGLSHTGASGAVAFVVLCSIDKGGGQIVNHLLYHSLNGHVLRLGKSVLMACSTNP